MSEFSALTSRIPVRKLPPGRRAFAMNHMLRLAKYDALEELITDLQDAIAWERHTIRLETLWEATRNQRSGRRGNASIVDNKLDLQVSAIEKVAQGQSVGKDRSARVKAARRILSVAFPSGVAAITKLPFELQLERVRDLKKLLESDLAKEVRLLSLEESVQRLGVLGDELRTELEATPEGRVTFAQVRAARNEGHERFVEVVAFILGRFRKRNAEDSASRKAYLQEYERQEAAVIEYRRRKRAIRDVDPETGKELESAAPEGDEAVA